MSITVKNLKKEFVQGGKKIEVLRDISFQIQTGELAAITGKSGSGKSTLLMLLAGLETAESGSIDVAGYELVNRTQNELTKFRGKNIGIVFQNYHLVPHLTALENVMLPMEIHGLSAPEITAKELLDSVQMSHRFEHFPNQMSGGENQRIAIARALALKPKLLLADEPSGSLDTETGEVVMNFFFKVVRELKTTTVLVTHNNDLTKMCDSIFTLVSGRLDNKTLANNKLSTDKSV